MTPIALIATAQAFLTRTDYATDPSNPTGPKLVTNYLCDAEGQALPSGVAGLPIATDTYTGATYVRIAEVMPNDPKDPLTIALKAQNAIHFASDDSSIHGWWIPAPDFNQRETAPAVEKPATATAA